MQSDEVLVAYSGTDNMYQNAADATHLPLMTRAEYDMLVERGHFPPLSDSVPTLPVGETAPLTEPPAGTPVTDPNATLVTPSESDASSAAPSKTDGMTTPPVLL